MIQKTLVVCASFAVAASAFAAPVKTTFTATDFKELRPEGAWISPIQSVSGTFIADLTATGYQLLDLDIKIDGTQYDETNTHIRTVGSFLMFTAEKPWPSGGGADVVFDFAWRTVSGYEPFYLSFRDAAGHLNSSTTFTYRFEAAPVPEPSTYALTFAGLAVAVLAMRRRKA